MRLQSKTKTKVWGFIALIPAIVFVGFILINVMQARTSLLSSSDYIGEFTNLLDGMNIDYIFPYITDSTVSVALQKFMALLTTGSLNGNIEPMSLLVCNYATYLMFIELLKIVVNAIVFIPNLINKYIDKIIEK